MTWLVALLVWTVCAVLAAPVVGRVLAHGGRAPTPRHAHPRLPAPRSPLSLS
jgi:hypothetical protein